ncbi:DUF5820 family protein [Halopelagius fulvigenes]|uniref:DUF5820 family protein n=1 Tax=Halopelagius fulvigenes TaxID=1198324 RepID=A0ABD5TW78_9EURY
MNADDTADAAAEGDAPAGWTLWNDEPGGRRILVYRPDVFREGEFPAECLPTIFVSNGSRARRPGAAQLAGTTWNVTLYLEPQVEAAPETYDSRDEAVAAAEELARRFDAGEVDYRSLYQVPREEYFERLDELTGRDAQRYADGSTSDDE